MHPFNVIDKSIHTQITKTEDSLNSTIFNAKQEIKEEILYSIKIEQLKNDSITTNEKGVTDSSLCNHEVVVSLTTYKERIHEVYLTIESIMQGTVKPNRIILWLTEDEFTEEELPIVLKKQRERGLEIRYCKDLHSYKKIIPTLQLCPEACIVTIDDDLIYEPDLLEHLIASYRKYPNCVSACRTRVLMTDENNIPLPYLQWKGAEHINKPSHRNFLTGGGGTLFPPHLLHEQVGDVDTFMTLAPTADDVWLNAMLLLNGVKVVKAFTHNPNGEDFLMNESEHVKPLWVGNNTEGGNDSQIRSVWEEFKLYDLINR